MAQSRALARAARLEWLQSWAAGPDRALYPEMITSPVVLTSAKGNGATHALAPLWKGGHLRSSGSS